MESINYSDQFMDWLKELGYTHCFFLGGGNVMHLLESASHRFECIPFVHEVAAGIAADYFNEISDTEKAFVLVTAGPGLTNLVTSIAGAWQESRELLIVGGQAKVSALSRGRFRQNGFQEIDGVAICQSITKKSITIDRYFNKKEIAELCQLSWLPRKGPVFLEFCLDVSAFPYLVELNIEFELENSDLEGKFSEDIEYSFSMLKNAKRPLLLIGGGVSRAAAIKNLEFFKNLGIPIATTFNGTDRVGIEYEFYAGRPNWYGSRWSNLINQQADLVIAVGTRLGVGQIGYNFDEYVPNGKIIQIDIDSNELNKEFPKTERGICCDSEIFLTELIHKISQEGYGADILDWQQTIKKIRQDLAVPDVANTAREGYVELHNFIFNLFAILKQNDLIIPCSSGGTYTGTMQVMLNKEGQKIVTSHGLASMGYGLSGAIGASLSDKSKRTILLEGDGGFAQNLQELGTLKTNWLNLKIFLMDNRGYASIRTTQKTYFRNHYVGCDEETGLGLPDWQKIISAYSIVTFNVTPETAFNEEFIKLLESKDPVVFVVNLDPDQLYFPKLGSKIDKEGTMKSNPLHLMDPQLTKEKADIYIKYLNHG